MTSREMIQRAARPRALHAYIALAAALLALVIWQPELARSTADFVALGLVQVAPLVVPGILLAAWLMASGAGDRVATAFRGRVWRMVLVATLVGAVLPVCGVTVLPLMVGLLSAGVPFAPVLAFWLASPVTDPAMLAATAATLGWAFAVGKLLAAIGLGALGGAAGMIVSDRSWTRSPLRTNWLVGTLSAGQCGTECGSGTFDYRIWRDPDRRARFWREAWSVTRLMLLVLIPAFAAESLLNAWLSPSALSAYLGSDTVFAIPLAVLVGGPAYLDGFAALPLTRGLMEHGMSPGAAMAFLVSGGVVSIWGAMAIFPVLNLRPFLFYLALAIGGSMIAGWVFGLFL